MKILLIGGTGFIGPCVVHELVRGGHHATIYSRGTSRAELPDGVDRIVGTRDDIGAHREEFRRLTPDVVVDFILSSGAQAEISMNTFRGIAKRIVVLSSGDVYRACGILYGFESGPLQPLPLRENAELRTRQNPYPPEVLARVRQVYPWVGDAYDKIPVEQIAMSDPELRGTVLRLPMVYGPGDPLHRLFPHLKRMDDQRPAILLQEDAARWRGPRGYVENVAAAIALATVSEHAAGEIYNIAEPDAHTEAEWVGRIGRAVGWNGKVVSVPKDSTPPHLRVPYNSEQDWVYDTTKIRQQLGFTEPLEESEALRRTIAWERESPPAFAPEQFDYAAEDQVLHI